MFDFKASSTNFINCSPNLISDGINRHEGKKEEPRSSFLCFEISKESTGTIFYVTGMTWSGIKPAGERAMEYKKVGSRTLALPQIDVLVS